MKDLFAFADIRAIAEHSERCVYKSPSSNFNYGRGQLKHSFVFRTTPKNVDEFKRLVYVGGQSLN